MSTERLHANELRVDYSLVRRLLAEQYPQWADLPLERVPSAGTVNALYRLGTDKVVRLPRLEEWGDEVAHEQFWLPRLAPRLPLAVPVPIVMGTPSAHYPCPWSIFQWISGEPARTAPLGDERSAAIALAGFIRALQQIDTTGAPSAEPADRGGSLAARDPQTRSAIAALAGSIETSRVLTEWEAALAAVPHMASPVWVHADLLPDNLLVADGKIAAVIDFGSVCLGDPACDLTVAWSLLSADGRDTFRDALAVDDATWARGKGWALTQALIALPYYRDTNPAFAAVASRMVNEVLADRQRIG